MGFQHYSWIVCCFLLHPFRLRIDHNHMILDRVRWTGSLPEQTSLYHNQALSLLFDAIFYYWLFFKASSRFSSGPGCNFNSHAAEIIGHCLRLLSQKHHLDITFPEKISAWICTIQFLYSLCHFRSMWCRKGLFLTKNTPLISDL